MVVDEWNKNYKLQEFFNPYSFFQLFLLFLWLLLSVFFLLLCYFIFKSLLSRMVWPTIGHAPAGSGASLIWLALVLFVRLTSALKRNMNEKKQSSSN